jgi:hypothetical protein
MSVKEILSVRKQRLSLQREADLLEQQEKKLTNDLIALMTNRHIDVMREGEDEATLVTSEEPVATNWPLLLDYIRENDALDLLQKRLTPSAIKARWLDKTEIPGIEHATKLSIKFNV